MRKLFVAFLALVGAAALFMPVREVAYADIEQVMVPEELGGPRAARLRTNINPGDPDTVWIGHVYQSFATGERPSDAVATMSPAGGYGPYHVGRGNRLLIRAGGTIGDNGTWDFDRFQAGETDSLFGWWPIARAYQSGASSRPDYQRAFFGLDYGNQVNYVINQGGPVDANGNKRTFGVVGLWHRDGGNIVYAASDTVEDKDPITGGVQDEITNVQPVKWSPTEVGGVGSTGSAWMGMRSHGDLSHIDLVSNGGTGNPFNSNLLQYQGNNGFNQIGSVHANGTDHNFPGYGSQMDQMLYRDIQLGEGDGLIVNFSFSTNMSTGANTETGVRAGWFDKDPISNAMVGTGTTAPASADGNFISSDAAGASAPVDSFMVYVGAPVNDAAAMLSNGSTPPVYDKKRRWFSEVLRLSSACGPGVCSIIGKQIGSYYGVNPPTAVSIDVSAVFGAGVLAAIKAVDGPGNGGTVRLVFRVKTNRGYDDENAGNPLAAFDSGTRGAAIVDNVVVNGWAASNGNFEALNAIDNRTTTSPTLTWKSTGKPPAVYFHTDPLIGEGLAWDDPCGDEEDPRRICDMYGNIVNSGDHDLSGHKDGGVFGSNTQDRQRWFVSPTINLCASGNGAPGDPGNFGANKYNAMGIDQEVAITTSDYIVVWTYYNAGHVDATIATANFFSVGWQAYPARQLNGNIKWGETRHVPAISFYGSPRFCADVTLSAAKSNSLIRTTNAQNRPDSLRVYLHRISRCFSFTTLTATECSPTGPLNSGTYFDNISVGLVDGAPPSPVTMSIWNLINDAFPANRSDALVPGGLDTAAAQIRTGFNMVPLGGTRPNISGDSVTVTSDAPNIRLDMVFRIKPGPGNYVTIGNPVSGVLKRPDVPGVANKATPGDGSFFGAYMASEGEFSSTAQHTAPSNMAHGSAWNEHIWNSARMDTVETNIFPTGNNGSVLNLIGGIWRSSYHESDGKFSTLGITKNICYMPSPGGATNASNIKCNGVIGVGDWDPANYPTPASGWDGVTVTTKEHTKIIPDGLLTPGSHVQYFFRRSDIGGPASSFHMGPDTNFVTPQATEGSTDGHRWQQFGVLPDRWKDPAWLTYSTALSPACMLYVDWCDRRGDERVWVGIADSIGATLPARFGAHNGWRARGDQDITVAVATDPTIAVYAHGGQPGSMWDMYGVKASESSTTSSSLGAGATAIGLATGKDDARGPTPKMLRTYYRVLLLLTGDLNAGNIGPYAGKTSNDVLLLNDFTAVAGGTAKPRYVWAMGRHFMEGQIFGGTTGHSAWPPAFFRATAVSGDYRFTTGFNQFEVAELRFNPLIATGDNRYSVANNCLVTNDLLKASSAPGATHAKYPDTVDPLPTEDRIASIYAPASGAHEGVTLVEGYRISQMGAFETLRTGGRNNYFNQVIINLYSGLVGCSFAVGTPVSVGENPNNPLVNFLALRSENPHRGGDAQLRFGITKKERVELKVYDVTGRLVKTLANREFAAGEHSIFWDGSNEDGQLVPRGVYFYQLRTPSFVSQKKLAVLKH